jgi:hypothetical protein
MLPKPSPAASVEQQKKRNIIMVSVAAALFVVAGVLLWLRSDTTPKLTEQAASDSNKVVETLQKTQTQTPEPPPIPESQRGARRKPTVSGS